MSINMRRGNKADFDPNKMLSGEFGVAIDTREAFICFAPGDTKKMSTYEDMSNDIKDATQDIVDDFTSEINQATSAANDAKNVALIAAQTATDATDTAYTAAATAQAAADAANNVASANIAELAGGTSNAITLAKISLTDGYVKYFAVKIDNVPANPTTVNGKRLYKHGSTDSPILRTGMAVTIWYSLAGDCFFIKEIYEPVFDNLTVGARAPGAIGENSTVQGTNNAASGSSSYAQGTNAVAATPNAHAEGNSTLASHGKLFKITAFDNTAKTITLDNVTDLAVGNNLDIKIDDAPALLGVPITAINGLIVTLNTTQTISNTWKYAIKRSTVNLPPHAEGTNTIACNNHAHAEGGGSIAQGNASHAEGYFTLASGDFSHSEGRLTKASGSASHAEGDNTIASGSASHAEGNITTASGNCSHAGGFQTKAVGDYSHSEGYGNNALGFYSHVGGVSSYASGGASFAHGIGVKASAEAQSALGRYNVENPSALLVIGNGTSDSARNNAFTVDAEGNIYSTAFKGYQINTTGYSDVKSLTQGMWASIRTAFGPGAHTIYGLIQNVGYFRIDALISWDANYGTCIIQSETLAAPLYGRLYTGTWTWKSFSLV